MSALHALGAYVVLGLTIATLGMAVLALLLGPPARIWLDRLILVTVVALLLAGASGLPLLVLVGPPADVLHLVYGLAAPLVLLGGRYLGRQGSLRRRAAFVSVAALALLGVVYRLFTTAGPTG